MVFVWFLLLLAWPALEIAIFIKVAGAIGWIGAILLTIATSVAGSWLMRIQGFKAMNRFLASAESGELPVATVIDGMGIFMAGMLLVLPGFVSDAIGLALFIPPLRRRLTLWVFRRLLHQPAQRGGWRPGPRQGPADRGGPRTGGGGSGFRSDNVVDAEFESVAPERKAPERDALPRQAGAGQRLDDSL
jgi:UPF0716 protein FxsA